MKFIFFVFLLFPLFFSCAESTKNKKSDQIQPEPNKQKAKTKKKEAVLPFLTFENHEVQLLNYGENNKETLVEVETPHGSFTLKLYNETPIHRANFIMLVKRGFFNTTVFYRVMDNFVVQGGNSDTWETQELKAKIGNYKLKPEFNEKLFHKRGALAAARSYTNNPEKLSSAFTFYIVQRGKIKPEGIDYLRNMEDKIIPDDQAKHYMEIGGSPSLDGEHTVFGEVIQGMEVIDAIAKVETDDSDWPKTDVWMKMKVIK